MSCVDVPVPSSPLSSTARLLDPGQHNGVHLQGGSRSPPTLNALAAEFDPGRVNNGVRQQAGSQGRARGGGAGRGGLSSAMSQQVSQPQTHLPARQPSGDAGPPTDSSSGTATVTGGVGAGANSSSSNTSGGGTGSGTGGTARSSGAAGGGGGSGGGGGGGRSAGVANANHLLNFQYESAAPRVTSGRGGGRGGARSGIGSRGPGGGGGGGGSASGGASAGSRGRYGSSKPQKYDKNKFLQANFRFLVSDAVDVSAYEADADKMFDWDDVLQVEMATAAPVQCPISLDSPPLCPQITPCGHIFSFPAIMHHLINHGGDQLRRSAPCPLCFAPVVARELRLVRVRRVVQPRSGDQLTLALIRRTRTSIIPQPVDPAAADAAAAAAATSAAAAAAGGGGGSAAAERPSLFDRNPFAKFVVGGDASELWRAAAEQLASCAMELVAEGGVDAALEAPYVYGALDQLAARARRWAEHRAECLSSRGLLAAKEGPGAAPEALGAAAEAAVKKMFTAAVSDVTSAREVASQRATLDAQFPSLAAPPPATRTSSGAWGQPPATSASPPAAAAATPAVPPTSGGSGGGAAAAPTAGSIAAAAPPPAVPTPGAAAGPPSPSSPSAPGPSAESQLLFDAVFSEDEVDEQPETGGSGGGDAAASSADGPGAASEMAPGVPPAGSSPPTAGGASMPDLGAAEPGGGGSTALPCGPSPPSAGAELLGSSPMTTRLNTPGTLGEFYTYQAVDGSWVFLHPLNLRCLLHAYGSYDSCPPVITARLLELEDVVQGEAIRRRWRFLSHLPLSGAFKLCEVAMSELVPPEALVPFSDELAAREKRRRRQRADERRQAAAEAAAAARAAAARLGPSAEELKAMPSLSQALGLGGGGAAAAGGGSGGLAAAGGAAAAALAREVQLSPSEVAESIALQASLDEAAAAAASAAPPPAGGVSFAHITKMGFAATGPTLGTSPPLGSIAAAATPPGAWGARAGGSGASQSAAAPAPGNPWGGSGAAAGPVTGGSGAPGGPWGGGKGVAVLKAAAASAGTPGKAAAGSAAAGADGGADGGGSGSGVKKGKSGKGMLLFSTGNQRKY